MSQAADPSAEASLTFVARGELFALPARSVLEVVPMPPVTRVPLAPAGLRGVANVRGRTVPVLDLVGMVSADRVDDERQLIVLDDDAGFGVAVTRVTGVAVHRPEEAAPLDLAALAEQVLAGFTKSPGPNRRIADPSEVAEDLGAEIPLVVIAVAGQLFALPLADVVEIARAPPQMPVVPNAGEAAVGMVALGRGLLPVFSLRALLGFEKGSRQADGRLVVVRLGDTEIALQVDDVQSVLRLRDVEVASVPAILNRGKGEARIDGVVRADGGLISVLSTMKLFDEETVARFAGGSQAVVTPSKGAAGEVFVQFRLGDERYALPAKTVIQVVPAPKVLTRLPRAPDFLVGLMNHAGAVLPLVDQARRFGLAGRDTGGGHVVVLRCGSLVAGLVVDAVERVVDVALDRLAPAPRVASGDAVVFDRIVLDDCGGPPLLIVDPGRLLDQAERDVIFRAVGNRGVSV